MKVRRMGSVATVLGLTGMLAASAGPAAGGQVRTDTTLGGFTVETESAPVKVLLDDPTVPIPRPPDSAIVEADPAYTRATLDTGPTARGLASALWPGNLLGDGWSQIVGNIPMPGLPATYPIKADARYPDNPHEANAGENGMFMTASAEGLDVSASAHSVPSAPAGPVDVGAATSTSTATVKDGVAIGTSTSKVTDFDFMSGLIHVGSVSTTLTTMSDGKKPTSSGSTVVSGLTIGGVGYAVDEKGAHLVGPSNQGTGAVPSNVFDPAKMLGITVQGVVQDESKDDTSASRTASGLVLVIDTAELRAALSPATGLLQGPLGTAISQLPKDPTGKLPLSLQTLAYFATQTTPKITLILGSGNGASDAVQPISFDFGPPVGFGPGPAAVPVGPPPVGGTTGPVVAPVSSPVLPPVGPAPAPSVAEPVTRRAASDSPFQDPFHGIPAAVLLLVGAVVGTAGAGLLRLRVAALAADAGSSLPDLRGDAS